MGHDLQTRGAEDTCIGDQVAVDAANPLERIEEDDEEYEDRRQQHFGGKPEAEPHHKDRAEHDAWQRVDDLDVGPDDLGQIGDLPQQHAEKYAACYPCDEPEYRFLKRHPNLEPERAISGAIQRPGPKPNADPQGRAEEELVDEPRHGRHLPADHDDQENRDLPQKDQLFMGLQALSRSGRQACLIRGGFGIGRHG